jgi:ABC-type Na+ transport system ATPase subunit NatA
MSAELQYPFDEAHPSMTLAESTLETAISVSCAELSLAITGDEQREVFARIQQLHRQRTSAQVARLERQRGLIRRADEVAAQAEAAGL